MTRRCSAQWLVAAVLGSLLAWGSGGGAGCASQKVTVEDPLADIRNPRLPDKRRVDAIDRAWEQAQSGAIDRITVRDELKTVAWSPSWPLAMRMEALRKITSDTKAADNNHEVVKLMLPREPDHEVTTFLVNQAVQHGWDDTVPAMIRSLSRPWPGVPDVARPEYNGIDALSPAKGVQKAVEDVFLNPPEETGIFGLVPADKVRADAWDLLGRIDPTGDTRAALVTGADAAKPGAVADMRAAMTDFRTLPLTGDELQWLIQLHDFRDQANRQWWGEAAAAVAAIDTAKAPKLQLRHLEPIRWATAHHPSWISATREELLSEIRQRLTGRVFDRRRARDIERWRPAPERLADWESKLSWADCVAILVVDEALRNQAAVQALFAQAEMDREDKTAEYGGLLRVDEFGPHAATSTVVLYPPRPGAREGDRHFVASTDMINQGAHSLAHYHFHAQERRNSEFAGPSADDLVYSARSGRTCLVFTSAGDGAMDADYYQPDGAVIDLGELKK